MKNYKLFGTEKTDLKWSDFTPEAEKAYSNSDLVIVENRDGTYCISDNKAWPFPPICYCEAVDDLMAALVDLAE